MSQRSWQAVATLLTFWPPGPLAARKVSESASSGSSKLCIGKPESGEGGRQRRPGRHVRLGRTRHAQRSGVEQSALAAAAAVDRVAEDRQAQPFGGMDADLMSAAGLGAEADQRLAVRLRDQLPAGDGALAG